MSDEPGYKSVVLRQPCADCPHGPCLYHVRPERSLRAADEVGLFDDDVLVASIECGDEVLTPKGDVMVCADDLGTVFSRRGASADITSIFTEE